MKAPKRIGSIVAVISILLAASSLPLYSLATTGSAKPGAFIISQSMRSTPRQSKTTAPAVGSSEMIEALASFYDTLITVLVGILVIVVGLSIWSLRYMSRTAAEEAARDAVHKAIEDSKSLNDRIEGAIETQVTQSLESISKQLEAHDKALRGRESPDETVEETEVLKARKQED